MRRKVQGYFNIVNGQYLGAKPDYYLLSDDEHRILFGEYDVLTGEFIAMRNPIKIKGSGISTYIKDYENGGRTHVKGVSIDTSIDYTGSKFTDESIIRGRSIETDRIGDSDAVEMAMELSREAKAGKIARGDTEGVRGTVFFDMMA